MTTDTYGLPPETSPNVDQCNVHPPDFMLFSLFLSVNALFSSRTFTVWSLYAFDHPVPHNEEDASLYQELLSSIKGSVYGTTIVDALRRSFKSSFSSPFLYFETFCLIVENSLVSLSYFCLLNRFITNNTIRTSRGLSLLARIIQSDG